MNPLYTQRTARLIGREKVALLAERAVLLFGAGGVGSFAAEALVRAGIGKLIMMDADCFDPSNINRQLGATTVTIGKKKVDVMKERLLTINPDLQIETYAEFYLPETHAGFIAASGVNYVVDAVDTVRAKIAVIEEAYIHHIPVISSMGAGNKLHPELFEVTTIEKTSVDPLAKILRKELKKRNIHGVKVVYSKEKPCAVGRASTEAHPSPGSISFVPAAVGMIMGGVVIRDLAELA